MAAHKPSLSPPCDAEEAHGAGFDSALRREQGMYFTPRAAVEAVLDATEEALGHASPAHVVDPACGAGAFLNAAAERFPGATLHGADVSAEALEICAGRVPRAKLHHADALRGGMGALLGFVPSRRGRILWVGNPPYNGTSSVLRARDSYRALRALLPPTHPLPKGTSLRDDFAFFLLLAAHEVATHDGVLAFITPSTLLDAFLYAPLRKHLLERLELHQVIELGAGVFTGTQVRTSVTVWRPRARPEPVRYRRRELSRHGAWTFGPEETFHPAPPTWRLRPTPRRAALLHERWSANSERLTDLVPIHFTGLKTRFDELLVDLSADRLLHRVDAFLQTAPEALPHFAERFGLAPSLLPKLRALKGSSPTLRAADPRAIWPFHRYQGARHRGEVPASARVFCYLERELILRGDHRLQGPYNPHAGDVKLLFNTRELPLCAALLEAPGCVTAHRHSRFAPLWVPAGVWAHGAAGAREGVALGEPVSNLSVRGRALAEILGGPRSLFRALVHFINSAPVQDVWAPAFATAEDLPVPLDSDFWTSARF